MNDITSEDNNKIMILADFDDTLINCDSMVTIFKKEKWYLNLSIICAGLGIIAAKLTKGDVLKKRSQLKYLMLEKFDGLSEDKIDEYVKYFVSCINRNVIDKINSLSPDKVVIASASSKRLIEKVLEDVLRVDVVIANSIRDDEDNNIGTWGADSDSAADSAETGKNADRGATVTINEFKTCYGEEKAKRFCTEIKDYIQYDIYVFSDSLSDIPIYKLGKECYLVENESLKTFAL